MKNLINFSGGMVEFVRDGKSKSYLPEELYYLYHETHVDVMLITFGEHSGLAVFSSEYDDLQVDGKDFEGTAEELKQYVEKHSGGGGSGIIKSLSEDEITASGGFDPKNYITEVTIPSGFTSITGFINLTGLTSVEIPNSIITVETSCFQNCQNLKEINIPNSVVNIRVNSFRGCKNLTNVKLGSGVETIGNTAFGDCIHLTSIEIPNSIVSIGDYVFDGCRVITSVTINATTPPTLGSNAFRGTPSAMVIYVPCEAVDAYKAASGWSTYASQIQEIPNSCPPKVKLTLTDGTTVEKECDGRTDLLGTDMTELAAKTDITEAKIGNCVTAISREAFRGMTSLLNVTLPNTITSIGEFNFEGCSALTSINLPNSITNIAGFAFYNCRSLSNIIIPSNTVIGSNAFRYTGIESLTIPNGVTSIGDYSFANCKSLTSVTIESKPTSIEKGVFSQCSNLTSITIPDSVTSIGGFVFDFCTSLQSVTIKATTPPTLGDTAFQMTPSTMVIYVPAESLEAYRTATNWSKYASRIQAIPTE